MMFSVARPHLGLSFIALLLLSAGCASPSTLATPPPLRPASSIQVVASNLHVPWAMEFLPDGTLLWDRRRDLVKHFSGGMKRRLEIARGLLHEPKIFFLDEPTLGLDPQTRNHVWGHLQRLNREKGITVFFTTHYMEEAERASSRIAIIDHGKIIAHGTAQALKEKTNTPSLEAAFLALTGYELRAEEAQGADQMRLHRRLWTRR